MRLLLLLFLLNPIKIYADSVFSKDIGASVATDEVNQSFYIKRKIAFGADGVATDVSTGNPLPITCVSGCSGGGGGASTGRTSIAIVRNLYSSVNVTTSVYVQLIASTSGTINYLDVFDSSGQTLAIAVGAAASEVNQFYIIPGGNGPVPLLIPSGSRVSIKAVSGTASTGELDITFYQ